MNKGKDFFKTCFNTVAGLDVTNESQVIAKEVVLSEIENLQQENQQLKEELKCTIGIVEHNRIISKKNKEIHLLKDNWNKLKKYIEKDKIYQEYKQDKLMDVSDFDKFCIQHCSDIEALLEENKQLKERVNYLERSNDRREDTILEQRQEISNLEDNRNKLKKWIDIEISENRDSEDLLKLYVELQEDNEKLLSRIRGFKSQQKEFIKYLEDEISKWHNNYDSYNYEYEVEEPTAEELVNKILQKYKEIVGRDN